MLMDNNDKTPLILDLERRIACVRKAGGSVNDGSAKDGYYDIPSLRNVCSGARDRAKELDCIEAEFDGKSASASIHKDKIALFLREERRTLLALVKEAEMAIDARIRQRMAC